MIFWMKISIKVFYKLVVCFLLIIARHAQNTQNSKFVRSLQYLLKIGRDEVDFLYTDRWWVQPGIPKEPKITSMQCLKKVLRYEVDILHADKHESLLQVGSIIFEWFG